jgi:Secretion system C-terminal sorting domain
MTYSVRSPGINSPFRVKPNGTNLNIVTFPPNSPIPMNALLASLGSHNQFQFASAGVSSVNNPCGSIGFPNMGIGNSIAYAISNSNTPLLWPDENTWKAESWSYATLLKDSALLQSNVNFQVFMDSMQYAPLGRVNVADEHLKVASYLDAAAELTMVVPGNLVEYNHKVQKSLQVLMETEPENLDSTQVAELRAIAMMCPDVGGTAVWEARSLMELLGELIDGYDCSYLGNKVAPEGEAPIAPDWNVEVWPNPVSDMLHVQVRGNSDADGTFKLLNLHGQEVARIPISNGESIEISVLGIPSGTYLWKYETAGSIPVRGKIVIAK